MCNQLVTSLEQRKHFPTGFKPMISQNNEKNSWPKESNVGDVSARGVLGKMVENDQLKLQRKAIH